MKGKRLLSCALAAAAFSAIFAGCEKQEGVQGPKAPEQQVSQGDICTDMSIEKPPLKVNYKVGEYFNPTGLQFTASYENGFEDLFPLDGDDLDGWEPLGALSADIEEVTVRYKGCKSTINITVTERLLTEIKVTRVPYKTTYATNAELELDGLVVSATYNDGAQLPITDYTVTDESGETVKNGYILPETRGEVKFKVNTSFNGASFTSEFSVFVLSNEKLVVEAEAKVTGTPPTNKSYTVITGKHNVENGKGVSGTPVVSGVEIGTKIDFYVYSETAISGAYLVITAASLNRDTANNRTLDSNFNQMFTLSLDDSRINVGSDVVIAGRDRVGNESFWFLWTDNLIAQVNLKAGFTKITIECVGKIVDSSDNNTRVSSIDKIEIQF